MSSGQKPSGASQSSVHGLQSLIENQRQGGRAQDASSGRTITAGSASPASSSTRSLNELLSGGVPLSPQASEPVRMSLPKPHKPLGKWGKWAGALAITLLPLGLAGYWMHRHDPVNQSKVATHLLAVARDLDIYRDMHRAVPRHLTELSSFPADAAQWAIEDYDIQMTENKLEFFLVDLDDSHLVIARQGNEVWMYDSKDKKLKRAPN